MSWRAKTRKYEPTAYFVCLAIMAASLTLSPFLMGATQFLLFAIWILMGDPIKEKLQRFFHSKTALIIVSLYLLHLIGLIYTSDFQYALKDLKVKLPILLLPLVLSSVKPLDKKRLDLLMLIYVVSVFIATCISFGNYLQHDYDDVRHISQFISHIRFCLNIVLAIGIIGYYLFTRKSSWWMKLMQIILSLWLGYQLYLFESISGYLAFIGMMVAAGLFLYFTKVKGIVWRLVGCIVIVGFPVALGIYCYRLASSMLATPTVDFKTLDKKTAQGNNYWHDTVCFPVENGQFVGLYFCRLEMREAWNRRSSLDYDGTTLNGENLEATLARYLTSKGLRKDAEGIAALTDQDIQNVEHGIANYENYSHPGLVSRLSETLFEYNQYRRRNEPNGGSLSQRIEYTRASVYLIKKHPVFGVGTGDIPDAYMQAYDDLQSPLQQRYRHKAHNQYLSITVGFGLVGLLVFLVALLYPYLSSKRYRTFLYTIFLAILLISMLPEDTIETQAGVTWFAFFNTLLIFAFKKEDIGPKQ